MSTHPEKPEPTPNTLSEMEEKEKPQLDEVERASPVGQATDAAVIVTEEDVRGLAIESLATSTHTSVPSGLQNKRIRRKTDLYILTCLVVRPNLLPWRTH